VDKVAGYVERSHECQMLAAITDEIGIKMEYERLAELWLALAEQRQEMLNQAGYSRPH